MESYEKCAEVAPLAKQDATAAVRTLGKGKNLFLKNMKNKRSSAYHFVWDCSGNVVPGTKCTQGCIF
jgi:hypothetical protein